MCYGFYMFSVKHEPYFHPVTKAQMGTQVKKVCCFPPKIVGDWSLATEDWRLYEVPLLGKHKMLPDPYPQDPDKTMQVPDPDRTFQYLDVDTTVELEVDPSREDIRVPPPQPSAGTSSSSQPQAGASTSSQPTPAPAPRAIPQATPHPDPEARQRDAALKKYFQDGRRTHRELVAAGKLFDIDYCKELADEQTQPPPEAVIKARVVKCPICKDDKEYSSTQRLRNHYRRKHTDLKRYSCAKCDGEFSDSGALKKHLEEIHHLATGKRQAPIALQCHFCEERGIHWVTYSQGRYNAHTNEHEYVSKVWQIQMPILS